VLQVPGAAQRNAGNSLKPQWVEAELTAGSEPAAWLVMHGSAVNQAAS
jgi:hypothetical protein